MASKACGPHKASSFTESHSVVHNKMKEDTERALFRSTLLQHAMQLGLVDLLGALQNNNNIRQLFQDRFQDKMKWSGFLQVFSPSFGGIQI
jgi:hypothetical protein